MGEIMRILAILVSLLSFSAMADNHKYVCAANCGGFISGNVLIQVPIRAKGNDKEAVIQRLKDNCAKKVPSGLVYAGTVLNVRTGRQAIIQLKKYSDLNALDYVCQLKEDETVFDSDI